MGEQAAVEDRVLGIEPYAFVGQQVLDQGRHVAGIKGTGVVGDAGGQGISANQLHPPALDRLAGDGLSQALEVLDARSRRIVEERWLKVNDDASGGMTLHELAAEYGVSAERIRQIEVAAMKKMRKALEGATA